MHYMHLNKNFYWSFEHTIILEVLHRIFCFFPFLAQSFYWFKKLIYILFLPLIFIEVYLINKKYIYGCTKWWFNICIDCEKWKWKSLSHVQLFETPWTIQSLEFSRPEYWSGHPFPSGDLPNPGIEPRSPTLQADSLLSEPLGKPSPYG